MNKITSFCALLLLAKASAETSSRNLLVECDDKEEQLYLQVLLDDKPEETSWTLVCDGVELWNVTTGSLASDANSWVTESTCVSTNVTLCNFSLGDSAGDGLNEDGWYALTFGATTVGVSDYGDANPFTELTLCVGTDCDKVALENGEEESDHEALECEDGEKEVMWEILLDAKPEETSWMLYCDNEMAWNVPAGSYSGDSASSWVKQSMCINETVGICDFTLSDLAGDGLDEDAYYLLRFGAETVAVSNGASTFNETSFCFGSKCDTCDKSFMFEIEFNDKPEETRFHLVCDGQVMWDHGDSSAAEAFDVIAMEECLDSMACCEIKVFDDGNDGIYYGSFQVKMNDEMLYYYDGSSTSHHFSEWSLVFSGGETEAICNKTVVSGDM